MNLTGLTKREQRLITEDLEEDGMIYDAEGVAFWAGMEIVPKEDILMLRRKKFPAQTFTPQDTFTVISVNEDNGTMAIRYENQVYIGVAPRHFCPLIDEETQSDD